MNPKHPKIYLETVGSVQLVRRVSSSFLFSYVIFSAKTVSVLINFPTNPYSIITFLSDTCLSTFSKPIF
jgi:hypothetical protein